MFTPKLNLVVLEPLDRRSGGMTAGSVLDKQRFRLKIRTLSFIASSCGVLALHHRDQILLKNALLVVVSIYSGIM